MTKTKSTAPKGKKALQLSRRSVYGGVALALTACAWTFFLGVLVGRGTAPVRFDMEKLGQSLHALREQVQHHQAEELQAYSAAVENKSELDFYEDLKGSGQDPAGDLELTRALPKPAPEAAPVQEKAAAEADAIPIKRPLPGLMPKKKGAVRPPQPGKPAASAAEAPSSNGTLTLQVASLRDPQMADEMVARLRKEGYRASRSGVTIPGQGVWYRVRVGRFADRDAAAATMRALQSKGLEPILVSR